MEVTLEGLQSMLPIKIVTSRVAITAELARALKNPEFRRDTEVSSPQYPSARDLNLIGCHALPACIFRVCRCSIRFPASFPCIWLTPVCVSSAAKSQHLPSQAQPRQGWRAPRNHRRVWRARHARRQRPWAGMCDAAYCCESQCCQAMGLFRLEDLADSEPCRSSGTSYMTKSSALWWYRAWRQ